jgi:CheY-like chemotaxis protein
MKTVLIIDDNEAFRCILAEWLRNQGCYPITAKNGFEGIQLACSHYPDFILCDINMPEMSGIEVLKQLRNNLNTLHSLFFFLTSDASLSPSLIQQLGAAGIIEKGTETSKLRQALVL